MKDEHMFSHIPRELSEQHSQATYCIAARVLTVTVLCWQISVNDGIVSWFFTRYCDLAISVLFYGVQIEHTPWLKYTCLKA